MGNALKSQAKGRVGWALFWLLKGGDGRALPLTLCISYSILCEIRVFPHPCEDPGPWAALEHCPGNATSRGSRLDTLFHEAPGALTHT